MTRHSIPLILWALLLLTPALAVQKDGTYDTTEPTDAQVPHWTSGWPGTGFTGWNYVGQIGGGASGVYVGRGWVLTAAHVGAGTFVTSSGTYTAVPGSSVLLTNPDGTTPDLCLFHLTTSPDLSPLPIATEAPVAFDEDEPGTDIVMLGFGGDPLLTWGNGTITDVDVTVTLNTFPYISNDFLTMDGTTTIGSDSVTNNSRLVGGDSGGGVFHFNTTLNRWELVGLNEAREDKAPSFSAFVQLNTYNVQIEAIINPPATDTPIMPWPALLLLAALLFAVGSRFLGRAEVVR